MKNLTMKVPALKHFKIKNNLLMLLLFTLTVGLVACEKDKDPVVEEEEEEQEQGDQSFSMMVDGQLWTAKSTKMLNFLNVPEEGPSSQIIQIHAYDHTKKEVDDANNEEALNKIFLSFFVPEAEVENPIGRYPIGSYLDDSDPGHHKISVTGMGYFRRDGVKYGFETTMVTEDIEYGHITIDKFKIGDLGTVQGLPLGRGYLELEGTFEFNLYPDGDKSKDELKLRQGKFKLIPSY